MTSVEGGMIAELERVRALAETWVARQDDDLESALQRRMGEVLLTATEGLEFAAADRLRYVTQLATGWMTPGNMLFAPTAGQAVLDAIKGEDETRPHVYIVITDDRHSGIEATPFADQAAAEAFAEREVEDNARHPEDIIPEDRELNDAMIKDGWTWFCRYGIEGDSVRVVRRELR